MDDQNLFPKSLQAIMKPSVKWWTLSLIKQAVIAKPKGRAGGGGYVTQIRSERGDVTSR